MLVVHEALVTVGNSQSLFFEWPFLLRLTALGVEKGLSRKSLSASWCGSPDDKCCDGFSAGGGETGYSGDPISANLVITSCLLKDFCVEIPVIIVFCRCLPLSQISIS